MEEKVENVEKTKKTKSKKGIVIAIIVIVVVALAGFAAYHKQQLEVLTEEMEKVKNTKTLNSDGSINKEAKIDMEIKTKGSYAVVEETLKNYINEALVLAQDVNNIYSEEMIQKIMSAENIQNDGPDFVETKAQIAKMKADSEEYLNKFVEILNKENMMSAIDDKPVSDYYKELYKTLAVDGENGELEETAKQMEEAKKTVTEGFEYIEKVLDFLSKNKSSWTVEGEQIMFYSQDKLNEFNKITAEIPEE